MTLSVAFHLGFSLFAKHLFMVFCIKRVNVKKKEKEKEMPQCDKCPQRHNFSRIEARGKVTVM